MQTAFGKSQRLSDFSNVSVEFFIIAFTILPFITLLYFYQVLPERVPLFMHLNGDVAVWGEKTWLSVFRVPLMAAITQVFCLLVKYGVWQSEIGFAMEEDKAAELYKQSVSLNLGLWDWFRCLAAFKMCAASFDTIFLSIERFNFYSKPAFIITFFAASLSIPVALFYGYRLLLIKRELKEEFGVEKITKPVNASYIYGGFVYFNPNDSALFVGKYFFNFANKWVYIFIACIIAYPLLVFLPT